MKTYKELLFAYVRIIEMCDKYNAEHGTNVKPWNCVKYKGDQIFYVPLIFDGEPDKYTFAISILEAKPVFIGNKVWLKKAEQFITITDLINFDGIRDDFCSWNPPKREPVIINGVELPQPLKELPYKYDGFTYDRPEGRFYFNNCEEFKQWEDYFISLLLQARDKED